MLGHQRQHKWKWYRCPGDAPKHVAATRDERGAEVVEADRAVRHLRARRQRVLRREHAVPGNGRAGIAPQRLVIAVSAQYEAKTAGRGRGQAQRGTGRATRASTVPTHLSNTIEKRRSGASADPSGASRGSPLRGWAGFCERPARPRRRPRPRPRLRQDESPRSASRAFRRRAGAVRGRCVRPGGCGGGCRRVGRKRRRTERGRRGR